MHISIEEDSFAVFLIIYVNFIICLQILYQKYNLKGIRIHKKDC